MRKKLNDIIDWSNLIWFDNNQEKYIIRDEYNSKFCANLSEMEFSFRLLSHLKEYLGGDLSVYKRNASFFLFYSFLVEKDYKQVKVDRNKNNSERYLKLLKEFTDFLRFHNFHFLTNQGDLVWNYVKIEWMFRLFSDLFLLHKYSDGYFIFGDKSYFQFFFKNILKEFVKKIKSDNLNILEIKVEFNDFLKFINNNYIYLLFPNTTNNEIPFILDKMLNWGVRNQFINIYNSGDAKQYQMKNGKFINILEIFKEVEL